MSTEKEDKEREANLDIKLLGSLIGGGIELSDQHRVVLHTQDET